jgi:hypothetical protein
VDWLAGDRDPARSREGLDAPPAAEPAVPAGLHPAERRLRLVVHDLVVEGTVKGHVSAILTRLGAENRVQAAIVAHEAGLTS